MKKLFFKLNKKDKGFTILEVMVAVALFVVIVTFGIGALLNANTVHKKNEKIRSLMDNLNFIVEDMSRNMRTGDSFKCGTGSIPLSLADCPNGGNILAFNNANIAGSWVYAISDDTSFPPYNNIYKSTTGDLSQAVQLNPEDIEFDDDSGFIVSGALAAPGDTEQPYIIIKLSGKIFYKGEEVMPFSVETSVSQRLADIAP
jgi:prepilin-type N-terminal cleavage/methylation domain-containing protein